MELEICWRKKTIISWTGKSSMKFCNKRKNWLTTYFSETKLTCFYGFYRFFTFFSLSCVPFSVSSRTMRISSRKWLHRPRSCPIFTITSFLYAFYRFGMTHFRTIKRWFQVCVQFLCTHSWACTLYTTFIFKLHCGLRNLCITLFIFSFQSVHSLHTYCSEWGSHASKLFHTILNQMIVKTNKAFI